MMIWWGNINESCLDLCAICRMNGAQRASPGQDLWQVAGMVGGKMHNHENRHGQICGKLGSDVDNYFEAPCGCSNHNTTLWHGYRTPFTYRWDSILTAVLCLQTGG